MVDVKQPLDSRTVLPYEVYEFLNFHISLRAPYR